MKFLPRLGFTIGVLRSGITDEFSLDSSPPLLAKSLGGAQRDGDAKTMRSDIPFVAMDTILALLLKVRWLELPLS